MRSGGLRARGDLAPPARCASSSARARRHEAVGEAHAQRLLAGDAAAGEDQVERVAVAEQPRQPDGAAVHQRDAPAPAVDAEHRVLGRDAQVAPGGELEPARDGVALDGGDHRLAEQHARRARPGRRRRARGARRAARPARASPSDRRRRRTCRSRRSAPRRAATRRRRSGGRRRRARSRWAGRSRWRPRAGRWSRSRRAPGLRSGSAWRYSFRAEARSRDRSAPTPRPAATAPRSPARARAASSG